MRLPVNKTALIWATQAALLVSLNMTQVWRGHPECRYYVMVQSVLFFMWMALHYYMREKVLEITKNTE